MATNTEGIFVGHPRRGQIGVAVLLAGTITTIPQAILKLATGLFPSPLFIFGVLHALTLLCGLWAWLAWPGRHYKGLVALGSLAGLLDLAINWSIRQLYLSLYSSWPQTISSRFSWGPIERLDYLSIIGIAALFTAGGLIADRIERRRGPEPATEPGPEPGPEPVTGPVTERRRPPGGKNDLFELIKELGPY